MAASLSKADAFATTPMATARVSCGLGPRQRELGWNQALKQRWPNPLIRMVYSWLVVFRPAPLKNDGVKVSWGDEIPKYDGKVIIQPCSKPPTRYVFYCAKIPWLLSCFTGINTFLQWFHWKSMVSCGFNAENHEENPQHLGKPWCFLMMFWKWTRNPQRLRKTMLSYGFPLSTNAMSLVGGSKFIKSWGSMTLKRDWCGIFEHHKL